MLIAALLMTATPQDAGTVAKPERAADGTQRWSILVDPCAATTTRGDEDIVVCGAVAENPRLPLPGERGPPDRPMPSNPYVDGRGALVASVDPCATRSEGCTTGLDLFGGATFIARAIGKLVDPDSCCEDPGEATNPVALIDDIGSVIKRTFKKKPDKSNRIAIPLDDPADQGAGPAKADPTP